jgi:hypothetical protein
VLVDMLRIRGLSWTFSVFLVTEWLRLHMLLYDQSLRGMELLRKALLGWDNGICMHG